jgi:hypothetical protein
MSALLRSIFPTIEQRKEGAVLSEPPPDSPPENQNNGTESGKENDFDLRQDNLVMFFMCLLSFIGSIVFHVIVFAVTYFKA